MRFEGTLDVGAPRWRVWSFLVDPEQVAACAPDIQEVRVTDPTHFRVSVRSGIGPIRATFAFDVEFAELREPERAVVRASGRAPGSSVQMINTIELADGTDGRTTVDWASDVAVSGTIANIGARFMQAAADKTTREVFACIKEQLEGAPPPRAPT